MILLNTELVLSLFHTMRLLNRSTLNAVRGTQPLELGQQEVAVLACSLDAHTERERDSLPDPKCYKEE